MSQWKQLKWGDIATLEYGKSLRGYQQKSTGYPVFGTNGKIGYNETYLCEGPGIIIGRKGAYRGVHFSSEPFYVIDTAFYLKLKDKNIDWLWAYYELLTKDINSMDSGSAIPSTSRSDFYDLPVNLPPLKYQKLVSLILSRLDQKIQINKQMNQTLEEIAMLLYKHWFVDFEPFQDGEFVETEMGMIPKGWEVKKVFDLGEVVTGKTPSTKKSENYGFDIPFIKIPDMHNQVYAIKTETMLSTLGAESQNKKYLPKNTVCVSCIATPGLVCLTDRVSQTNQQINSVVYKGGVSPYFTYLFFRSIASNIISLGSGGTATLNLNKTDFSNIKLILPNADTMASFDERVQPLFESIRIYQNEVETFEQTRNFLLPKLLSGEIDLSKAKETVENMMQ